MGKSVLIRGTTKAMRHVMAISSRLAPSPTAVRHPATERMGRQWRVLGVAWAKSHEFPRNGKIAEINCHAR